MIARFADHHAAIGMADEDRRLVLLVEDELRRCHIIGKRRRRVLHDANLVAVLLQLPVDAQPAGAIDEAAVDQNDVELLFAAHMHSFLMVLIQYLLKSACSVEMAPQRRLN